MISPRPILLFLGTFAAALLAGCANDNGPAANDVRPATAWFDIDVDQTTVRVQLSITQEEMARGLMGRTDLGPDEGMLFVYRRPIQASFWMRNTPLPLDIGFFNPEGILLEVYPLFPYDETSVRSRSDQVQFALEMNQGWFSKNGIRRGAALNREHLRDALQARGHDPVEFGL